MIAAVSLDAAIARLLKGFEQTETAYTAERLIRMGACASGRTRTSVMDACRRLGCSKDWLRHMLERDGYPGPKTLLVWGQIVAVMDAYACGVRARKLDDIARALGWGSGFTFSASFNLHVGMWPRDWMGTKGSMLALCDRLVQHWLEIDQDEAESARTEAAS